MNRTTPMPRRRVGGFGLSVLGLGQQTLCWYRRGLVRRCGKPTTSSTGLCAKHRQALNVDIERLNALVERAQKGK